MISIIIPVYNEGSILKNTVNKISDYFKNKDYEIIVIDDGSTDDTRDVLSKFDNLVINDIRKNKGKGYSVKEGIFLSKGNIILMTDADLSTPIDEFHKLKKYIKNFSIVIGSRSLKDSKVENTFIRKLLGRIGNIFIRSIVRDIKDTQCGFKLFDAKIAKKLFSQQTIRGFGFDFEILFLAQKYNYNIKEIPIDWNNSADSKVKPIHYIITLFELFSIIINNIKGKYLNL
tara:strand:+ start:367 stop:1056 length:690 start_codon:yes stop_codon:yes gene_type:complete